MVAAPERSSLAIAEGALRAGPVACELTANELRAARTAVAATDAKSVSQTRAADLCRLAHETYKLCIATSKTSDSSAEEELKDAHLRALCLLVFQRFSASKMDDADLASLAKHWIQVSVLFMVSDESAESRALLDTANQLLDTASPDDAMMLEARCRVKATKAQLQWVVGNPRASIEKLEEVLPLLDKLGARCLPSTRRFLADNIALSLACAGHADAEEEMPDAPASEAQTDRRLLIRLTDLSLSFLGEDAADTEVRDRALRLRAWLCILEEELDMAAQSLQRHSGGLIERGDEMDVADEDGARTEHKQHATYVLLKLALQLKTSQKAEACAQAITWLTTDSSLSFDRVRDTIDLLCRNGCGSAALEAASALLEGRLSSATDPTSSKLYSEIAELKFRLLTHGQVADSSAAAAHLEEVIDSQTRGKQLATPETLRRFARKLWNSGCAHADAGQLHHAIEDIERANRFLEESGDAQAELATTLSTLSHFYLNTDGFQVAVERAERALQLLRDDARTELELPGQAKAVRSQGDPACLARIVLIKAHLRLGQPERSKEHIDGLLSTQPQHDHVLVGAVCEEIASMGQGYEPAVVALLERFVALLESAPHGAPERSKLAGATRSLITYREANHKRRGTASGAAAEGCHATEANGQSGAGDGEHGLLQHRQKLMADVRLVARRTSQLGASAVCDGSTHLEWLAQKAWDEGVASAKANSPKQLELAVQLLQAHGLLLKSLVATDERREATLRSLMVITHCSLALFDSLEVGHEDAPFDGNDYRRQGVLMNPPDAEASASSAAVHLNRAAESLADAFRLRQRGSFEPSAAAKPGRAAAALFDPDMSLCVLNFEVSLRRGDNNLNALLSRAAETAGVRVSHFMVMAESARKRHNVGTQRVCLEHALRLLLRAESREYASIALVLRRLIHTCGSREEQLPHFHAMTDALSAYSAANCPLDADLLQWYLSSSYNMAVAYFNDKELELAEKWFAVAFKFLHFAPPVLQSSREELMQSYDLVMKELSASRAYGQGRVATQSIYARMRQLVTKQTLEKAPANAVPP